MTRLSRNWPEFLMGLGIIAAGLVIAWEASTVNVSPIYAKVGPAAFLWLSAGLLIACGAVVAGLSPNAAIEEGSELAGPLTILAGLLVTVFLLEPLGFIPAATLLFVLTARGLGSRAPLRDVAIGLVLCIIAYLVFAKGLGLRLPAGALFA